ncbi:hypothetical protein [Roseovarius aestuariivivens]|uniref:hypothetical protein n=1 Tax=Roseovarius aestuariivivens TaxID=1888910 RepID=UPI001AEBB426|nr:hypothetical protein [Roseovarius aestuariivivens]
MKYENRNPRVLLSILWIFVILNFFARDIHELGRPGMLEQMISGTIDGVVVTDILMLLGGDHDRDPDFDDSSRITVAKWRKSMGEHWCGPFDHGHDRRDEPQTRPRQCLFHGYSVDRSNCHRWYSMAVADPGPDRCNNTLNARRLTA